MGGDYFAPDIHRNPLLHLWSLSVEEQFYLFIPLLCAMIWKFRRNLVAPVFALLAILSLSAAIYALATGKQNSAFYLLHFRAWELLIGSLLAMMLPFSNPRSDSDGGATPPCRRAGVGLKRFISPAILAIAGLLMILVPYAILSSKTPFPGAAAISSVFGTALLIRYGQAGWINRLLSWRPFVATGKVSYSLYLWHWPVTVFWKYAVYDQLYWYDYAGMFLLSLLLGYLSWRFVEVPVRTSPAWTMRRSFTFAATGIVLLVSLGGACVFGKGWPTTLHPKANQFAYHDQGSQFVESWLRNKIQQVGDKLKLNIKAYPALPLSFGGTGTPHLGNPMRSDLFMLGDSHAGVLCYGLDIALHENGYGAQDVNYSGKNMFILNKSECQTAIKMLQKMQGISKVLLVQYWVGQGYKKNKDNGQMYNQLETFANVIKAMGKTLYIATDVPHWNASPGDIKARMEIIAPREIENDWYGIQPEQSYDQDQGENNRQLSEICRKTGAILVPLHLAFKQNDYYVAFGEENNQPVSLYRDVHHLSPYGSLRAARFLMPYLFAELGDTNATGKTSSAK